jgi:hypothetical protein
MVEHVVWVLWLLLLLVLKGRSSLLVLAPHVAVSHNIIIRVLECDSFHRSSK